MNTCTCKTTNHDLDKNNEFLYSLKHSNGLQHPVVTLWTDKQLRKIRLFASEKNSRLELDKILFERISCHLFRNIADNLSTSKIQNLVIRSDEN